MRSASVTVFTGRRGFATAKVLREDGSETLLHSLYDPVREAASFVPAEVTGEVLVFLGCGLGYHIPPTISLSDRVSRVILIDCFRELAEMAAARIANPAIGVDVVSPGDTDPDLPASLPFRLDGVTTQIIPHHPSIDIRPAWYSRFRSLLATDRLQRYLPAGRRTGRGEKKILALYGAYFCESECIRGFRSSGHRVATLDYRNGSGDLPDRFQEALLQEKPDMVFSVNSLGLDRRGIMAEILAGLGIPLALWFVDSPEFILYGDALPPREISRIFVWDRAHLPRVEKLGYRASHLPLAADEALAAAAVPSERYQASVSFVGNSLASGFLSRLGLMFPRTDQTMGLAEQAMETLLLERPGGRHAALDALLDGVDFLPPGSDERLFFRAYVLHGGTTLYRINLLRRILPLGPRFFGDPQGWQKLFGPDISVHPDVNYYSETPSVYASSEINFNATSLQMPSAVNQRVFDVPLCGGFLLTDRQDDLFALFDQGEIATYQGVDDVADVARFYLGRPDLRGSISRKARERVLREHTYRHRMGRVVEEVLGG